MKTPPRDRQIIKGAFDQHSHDQQYEIINREAQKNEVYKPATKKGDDSLFPWSFVAPHFWFVGEASSDRVMKFPKSLGD